jgi:hypothetical protein
MGEEQIKEASWVASYVSGVSAYLYGTRYSLEQAEEELDQIVEHIKSAHG